MKLQVKVKEMSFDELVNAIETSTYGSDWLSIHCPSEYKEMYDNSEYRCHSETLAEILLAGGKIELEDHEQEKTMEVDLNRMLKQMGVYIKKYPQYLNDIQNEDDDYYTWNNYIQVVMYGEIIYG